MPIEEVYFYYIGLEKIDDSIILIGSVNTNETIVNTMAQSMDDTIKRMINSSIEVNKIINYLSKKVPDKTWSKSLIDYVINTLEKYKEFVEKVNQYVFRKITEIFSIYKDEFLLDLVSNIFAQAEKNLTDLKVDINIFTTKSIFEYTNEIEISKLYGIVDNEFMNYCWYQKHSLEYNLATNMENEIFETFKIELINSNNKYEDFYKSIIALETYASGFNKSAEILDYIDDTAKIAKLIRIVEGIEKLISQGIDVAKIDTTLYDSQNIYMVMGSGIENIWK
jgi:hypothetical protein